MGSVVMISGLSVFVSLVIAAITSVAPPASPAAPSSREEVRFLAVGDINLGRNVGQKLLAGDIGFPFAHVRDELNAYDVVFGNLECPLSDQDGETQHPRNNLLFTGPPEGAASLRLGGITVVSTANNHAMDYGVNGLLETIRHLREEEMIFAGTGESESELYQPTRFSVKGIRFALFACTALMNIEDRIWTGYVAEADSARLFPAIRSVRPEADFVILSYHGGAEYASDPGVQTEQFARGAVDAGVDLVLGHHPHVPQRIEQRGDALIVYSLGNFVFRQPFEFWTQRSFALEARISPGKEGAVIRWYHPKPITAGDQPRFQMSQDDRSLMLERVAAHPLNKGVVPEWLN